MIPITVNIKIGDVTHKLTKEQVIELRDILNSIFPDTSIKVIREIHEHFYEWPASRPRWNGPYWSVRWTPDTTWSISADNVTSE